MIIFLAGPRADHSPAETVALGAGELLALADALADALAAGRYAVGQ